MLKSPFRAAYVTLNRTMDIIISPYKLRHNSRLVIYSAVTKLGSEVIQYA